MGRREEIGGRGGMTNGVGEEEKGIVEGREGEGRREK